jgi:hypothetical protein
VRYDPDDEMSMVFCDGAYITGRCSRGTPSNSGFDVCSVECDADLDCTQEQSTDDSFCFEEYLRNFEHIEVEGYCAETGKLCIGGGNGKCCQAGDRCVASCGLSGGSTFCFVDEYRCAPPS